MAKPSSVSNVETFGRLWLHECSRVFHDRLINISDRAVFKDISHELLKARFKCNTDKEDIFEKNPIIFGNLLRLEMED
jgi:dynein heavy chain